MEYLVVSFCVAITLHNLEEAIWLPRWSQHSSQFQKPVTSSEFHFAVIMITILANLSAFSYLVYQNQIKQSGLFSKKSVKNSGANFCHVVSP